MFKAVENLREQKGFTLIELLIVIAIIGILAAIAIPGYLGMQERGRKGAVTRAAEAAVPELQAWMTSVKKAGTPQGTLTEVDTDGNGAIELGSDMTNDDLAAAGVVKTFVDLRAIGAALGQSSPWAGDTPLWALPQGALDLAACEAVATAGQITLCYNPADDATIRQIFLVARDITGTDVGTAGAGNVIFSKTISAD